MFDTCRLCPRACGTDRRSGGVGYCGETAETVVARAALHMWEEPCISGQEGSGTVFFAGCNLRCDWCDTAWACGKDAPHEAATLQRITGIAADAFAGGVRNVTLTGGEPLLQENIRAVMETEVFCRKKDMILVNYEAPDGSKKHNRLWNGGNGWGTVKLYDKINGEPVLVDEVEAAHIGCEYGEYDE